MLTPIISFGSGSPHRMNQGLQSQTHPSNNKAQCQ